jgi:hypothetical protein
MAPKNSNLEAHIIFLQSRWTLRRARAAAAGGSGGEEVSPGRGARLLLLELTASVLIPKKNCSYILEYLFFLVFLFVLVVWQHMCNADALEHAQQASPSPAGQPHTPTMR